MREATPEARPPAFPFPEPEVPAGRPPRASDAGLLARLGPSPKHIALGHVTPAGERPPLRHRIRDGLWRVAVAEASMAPALRPGDWLLLDPTCAMWPRRGTVVVFREPGSDSLAIKRVAARPGDRVRISHGILHLAADEAWLLGDNLGPSIDSRRYGPVPLESLVGRAWFRYGPISRLGPLGFDIRPERPGR